MDARTPGPIKIAYTTAGDAGTPVVLIMGYSVPGRGWVNQVKALKEHHRVVWFDNRGVGGSDAPPGPYSMGQMAGDVANLLDHVAHDQVHVVGVSMGGMIAQEFALQYRHRVRSLTLLATHPGGLRAIFPSRRGLELFMRSNRSKDRLETVQQLLYTEDYLTPENLPTVRRALEEQFGELIPVRNRLAQFAAILRHDTRARLSSLSGLSTLVIQPSEDLLVRPKNSERLATLIPGARLHTIRAGHGLIRQRAAEVNAALLGHFAEVDAANGG